MSGFGLKDEVKCQVYGYDCLGGLSSILQVLGSTFGGSEFQAEVKKIPSPAYTPKHMELGPGSPRPALTRVTVWVTAPLCKGGAGVRGFSRPA